MIFPLEIYPCLVKKLPTKLLNQMNSDQRVNSQHTELTPKHNCNLHRNSSHTSKYVQQKTHHKNGSHAPVGESQCECHWWSCSFLFTLLRHFVIDHLRYLEKNVNSFKWKI